MEERGGQLRRREERRALGGESGWVRKRGWGVEQGVGRTEGSWEG